MKRISLAFTLFAAACGGSSSHRGGGATGLVVIGSDYMSTAVSLVDPATKKLSQDDCLDSGAVTPVLSMALSGDVVTPSTPQADHQIVLIDRMNSALVWLDPTDCKVTHELSVATGFYSNPHDLVPLSASKAYVTRYQANATPSGTAGANDLGNDLLIINPSTMAITGSIDLSSEGATVGGVMLVARPNRAISAGAKVYVALDNLSDDFMTTGPGHIVIVDPSTDKIAGAIALPNYANCAGLDYIAGSQTLLISCVGDYNAAPDMQLAGSALLVYDVSGATPTLVKAIAAGAIANRPLGSVVAAVGNDQAVVSISGDLSGAPPDSLWSVTLSTGTAAKVVDADGSFTLGTAVADSDTHSLFVTNASATAPHVSVYDDSQAGLPELTKVVTNPKSGLPPRQVTRY